MSGTAENPISVESSSEDEGSAFSVLNASDELRKENIKLRKALADEKSKAKDLKIENASLRKAHAEFKKQVRLLTAENVELRSAVKAAKASARSDEARAAAAESRRELINRLPPDSASINNGRTVMFDRRDATIGIRVDDAENKQTGLTINLVTPGSQADKQGLTTDDVVIGINGNSMLGRFASTATKLITATDKVEMKLARREVMPSDVESRARKLDLGEEWKLTTRIMDALRSADHKKAFELLSMPRDEVVAMYSEQSGAAAPKYGEALLGLLSKPKPAAASSPEYPDLGHYKDKLVDAFDSELPQFPPQGREGMTDSEQAGIDSVDAGFSDLC